MIRLLWRTDIHLSDRSPASRKDDWTETVFQKLEQAKRAAAKLKVAAVIDGGDFFHVKSPSRNSHALVHRAVEHHADYPCPVYCTPGNHDAVYGDYSYLPQQPLGILFSSGVFNRLYDEHEVVFQDPEPEQHGHMGVPTIPGVRVRVVGIPYHGTKYDMMRFQGIKKGDEDFLVVVAHVLASPRGGTMFEQEDVIKYADLAGLDPDVWCFGHWHKDQGIQEINGKYFVNIGSMTRGALIQDEMDRKPGVVLLSFEKGQKPSFQTLRLKARPAEEVFDIDSRVRAETRETTMDAFVSSVRETLVESKALDLADSVEAMQDISDRVREKALLYLEQAR